MILTLAGTALHFAALPARLGGCLILLAAWIKARLILLDYLELRGAPKWSEGLQAGLAALIAGFLVLYLAA